MRTRTAAAAVVVAAVGFALLAAVRDPRRGEGARCGEGFDARGALCVPRHARLATSTGYDDALDVRVLVPAGVVSLGSSDWEAEGRVTPRSVFVPAFRLAAFETTRRDMGHRGDDEGRAATGLARAEAAAFCASRGGRLPSEIEWMAAATAGAEGPRRYPWGETGAVCRRAAWGLLLGPCAEGADGADTVGAHPDGDSALGLHDLAGNAAEWVASDDDGGAVAPIAIGLGIAKGGSWQSTLASDLRIWSRLELDPRSHDPRVGVRCAYPP